MARTSDKERLPIGQNPGDRQKRHRFKKKIDAGTFLNPAEVEWVETYDRYKAGLDAGNPPPTDPDPADPDTDDDGNPVPAIPPTSEAGASPGDPIPHAEPAAGAPAPDPIPPVQVPTPPPAAPRPIGRNPPPPRVNLDDDEPKKATSGNWRTKYVNQGDSEGREQTCVFMANHHIAILTHMSNQLTDVGVDPMFKLTPQLNSTIVMFWDRVLPPQFKLTPEVVATAVTTGIMTQRFLHRKKIAEAQKGHKEKQDRAARISKADAAREEMEANAKAMRARAAAEAAAREATDVGGTVPIVLPPQPMEPPPVPAPEVDDDDEERDRMRHRRDDDRYA